MRWSFVRLLRVRVLIVKTSSMGDVVHALPMVSDIARAFPQARIDWVVEEAFAEVPWLHPAITRVFPVALRRWRRHPFAPASWRELVAARRAIRELRYDAVIDCQGLVKSALVAACARGPVMGPALACAREPLAALFYRRRIRFDRARHAVDRHRALGAAALGYSLQAPEDFGLRARVRQMQGPVLQGAAGAARDGPSGGVEGAGENAVLLLTHASRASKRWPDAHWIALEHELARSGCRSWLTWGGEAERRASEELATRMRSARVLPRSTLVQLAAFASRVRLVVGLDTGLTHLSAAVGAPTVGIFCDYDVSLVGLRGGGATVSLGGVGQTPAVAQVLAAVAEVERAPCVR